MSSWLVDTQAVLWFLADDERLSSAAKQTMESADSVLLVSAASLWEIAIKLTTGKLKAPDDLPAVITAEGFSALDITAAHAWAVGGLPRTAHKDPFDRLLVAQARVERLPIISRDAALDQYGIQRLW